MAKEILKEKVEEEKYELNALLLFSQELFGVKQEIAIGAFAGKEEQKYTVKEAQKIVEEFLHRRIK
mgnify:FL=1